jgi:transposase, IS30 family
MKGDLTKAERLEIKILLDKNYSMRAMARVLGRSPNTLSYEIKVGSTNGTYDPFKAHIKAQVRKKYRRFQYAKIEKCTEIKEIIIEKLKTHWNPDEIAGWLKANQPKLYVSKSAIYNWLHTGRGNRYCDLLYSERHYRKKHKKKTKRVLIPERIGIENRPLGSTNRTRYGHYEADTIVSIQGGTGAILVLIERKSRSVHLWKLPNLKPAGVSKRLTDIRTNLNIKSITFDNGIENIYHQEIGVPTYFCDPYSSWQKGSVENVNKMIRRYIPKGSDLVNVTQVQLDSIADLINKKPRKILGYRTALEVARVGGVLLGDKSVLIEG